MLSNEIFYEFNIRDFLEMFTKLLSKNFNRLKQMKRKQIKKTLTFINIIIKIYYNNFHKFINFL